LTPTANLPASRLPVRSRLLVPLLALGMVGAGRAAFAGAHGLEIVAAPGSRDLLSLISNGSPSPGLAATGMNGALPVAALVLIGLFGTVVWLRRRPGDGD